MIEEHIVVLFVALTAPVTFCQGSETVLSLLSKTENGFSNAVEIPETALSLSVKGPKQFCHCCQKLKMGFLTPETESVTFCQGTETVLSLPSNYFGKCQQQ
jgi:hypothetical protein